MLHIDHTHDVSGESRKFFGLEKCNHNIKRLVKSNEETHFWRETRDVKCVVLQTIINNSRYERDDHCAIIFSFIARVIVYHRYFKTILKSHNTLKIINKMCWKEKKTCFWCWLINLVNKRERFELLTSENSQILEISRSVVMKKM